MKNLTFLCYRLDETVESMAGDDDGLSNAQAYFTQSAEAPPPANQEPDQEGQQYLGLANADQGKFGK